MSKTEIEGVVMYIKDKRTNSVSKPIPIPDIIFNQHDVEFEFVHTELETLILLVSSVE